MFASQLHKIRKLTFKYKEIDLDENSTKLFWCIGVTNFGDYLNKDLVRKLTDKKIEWVPYNYNDEYYMAIGSVLHLATDKAIVWGSGLISEKLLPIDTPKEILAVRGPLTRGKLIGANIKCPEIYGDPALILPEIYYPKSDKSFDLGIIPHYIDNKSKFFQQKFNPNVKIIDITQPNFEIFVDEVLSCKKIISSSLHGLIVADAYDVPALRVKFSNKIIGGDFKFNDYFLSVNRLPQDAIAINEKTKISDILQLNFNYEKKIDIRKLKAVSPFRLTL